MIVIIHCIKVMGVYYLSLTLSVCLKLSCCSGLALLVMM